MQLQAANISIVALEGAMLILVPSVMGLLLIGISYEEGITNEAIWKPFVLSKEFARAYVCVCEWLCMFVNVYDRQTEIMSVSKCRCHSTIPVKCGS